MKRTQVVIVGAGPVGLTLAMDLASRGIEVTVVEMRSRREAPSVKCNHISARSMEIFRRLGVAGALRKAGLPHDYPHDVVYRTTTTGQELARILIPSQDGRQAGAPGPDTKWPTPEPPHRINQIFIEPILLEHASAMPGVTLLHETRVDGFHQDDQGVTASLIGATPETSLELRCDYLIGCDGGRSETRKAIGVSLIGDAVVQRVQSTYIRAPSLLAQMQGEPAWATFSLNPRRTGNVYAIDGRETWLVHNYLREDEPDFESVDRDHSIRTILGVGSDFRYEILSKEDWYGRRLIAERFRDRRVFLCGDAAHIWVPYAGYGMNAGIADAADLAWLVAARLNGWGAAEILGAYEAERLPITEQVSRFAMNHAAEMARERRAVPGEIEDEGIAGDAARRTVGKRAWDLNVQQYCCAGLNFGYYYDASPLIAYDAEQQPAYSMGSFTPSTVPGCRLPHFYTSDGSSLYDRLGPDYTLIRFDDAADVAPLLEAARMRGVPLRLLDLATTKPPPEYRNALILVRPDQHIAWRGDGLPDDPMALIDQLRGVVTERCAAARGRSLNPRWGREIALLEPSG